MRNKLLLVGLLALTALPAAALAQPYDSACVQSNRDNRAAGTVVGAIGGALLGGAIAGGHDRGAGVVVGGVGGALAGNAIAGANDHPCPDGYYYRGDYNGDDRGPPPPPGDYAEAPGGLHARIDALQQRIDVTAQRGMLGPRQIDRLNNELSDIRQEDQRLHDQDGGRLREVDRDYLQNRLDNLDQRLDWMIHNG